MLGNMVIESNINPGIWESLIVNTENGFGLVQWTPATKLITWAQGERLDYKDGDTQLARIRYEIKNGLQWGANPYISKYGLPTSPRLPFKEWAMQENVAVTQLAKEWAAYYERPAERYYVSSLDNRQRWAAYYYNLIKETPEPAPTPNPPIPEGNGQYAFWFFSKKQRQRRLINSI